MKLTAILLLVFSLHISAKSWSQVVTFSGKEVSLENAFAAIEKQTGYVVFYDYRQINGAKPVTISVRNEPLTSFLDLCFKNQPFGYAIEYKTILITFKEKKALGVLPADEASRDKLPPLRVKVVDSLGQPLSGATIIVKNSKVSGVTDAEGIFNQNVAEGDVLLVSYVGYETRSVIVTSSMLFSTNNLIITLKPSAVKLENVEVVVNTGYQSLSKERATGSFVQIDNALLNRRVSSTILERLQGVASGVAFERSGSGTDYNVINIRGRSTIYSNADPLIVVDGFPYEGALTNINPDDVENITVLRDAAAASIWGTRAGNGVIVITTKKGTGQRPMNIYFNSNISVAEKPDLFYSPKASSSEVIDIESMLFEAGRYDDDIGNTFNYPALSPVVEILLKKRNNEISPETAEQLLNRLRGLDNRNDLLTYSYHRSIVQQYNISLNGGTEKSNYYISAGYAGSIGTLRNTNERVTLTLKNTLRPFKRLSINTGIVYTINNNKDGKFPGTGSVYPYEMLTNAAGNPISNTRTYRNSFLEMTKARGFLDWSFTPLTDATLNTDQTRLNEIRVHTDIRFRVLPWLHAELSYQFLRQQSTGELFFAENSYYARDLINRFTQPDPVTQNAANRPIPIGSIKDWKMNLSTANNIRGQLVAEHRKGVHYFTGIAGVEIREVSTSSNAYRLYGYDPDLLLSKEVNFNTSYATYPLFFLNEQIPGAPMPGTALLDRFRSLYANGAYTYKNRYIFSASVRKDASNYFGVKSNQRSLPLWSVGVKWNIDKEHFYSISWLPLLSFKLTYGFNGNINKKLTAFTTAVYGTNEFNLPIAYIENPPNPSLRWEKVKIINAGIDFATKNNRIAGSLEFYKKEGIDLISSITLDPTTGSDTYEGNVANTKGKGFDLQLTSRNVDQLFKWTTTLLLSYASDKVTKYFVNPEIPSLVKSQGIISPVEGRPVYSVYSYKWAGLDPNTGNPRGWVGKDISQNYDQLVNPPLAEVVYNGPLRAPLFGAIRNGFQYKKWTLSVNITYKAGHYFRRSSINYATLVNNLTTHKDYAQRWLQPGDEQHTTVPSFIYPITSTNRETFYNNSEVLVEKGDHIRLQDIQFSYDFSLKGKNRLFKSLQLYGYINNIGILWKANNKGIDPDYYEQTIAPAPRSISLGVKIEL